MARPESTIQTAIIKALRAIGCWVGVSRAGHRGKGAVRSSFGKGCPDLLVVYRGAVCWLETKTIGGKLSTDQKEWHRTMEWHGVPVWVVRAPIEAVRLVIALEAS